MGSLAQCRALLTAALGFMRVRWHEPLPRVAATLSSWMNSWRGAGALVAGMTAQGFNVELREYPEAWRANFYPTGMVHSIDLGSMSTWEPTPWRAVQHAAWEALHDPRGQVG